MKIVNLDGDQLNPGDLSWEGIATLGDLTTYPSTAPDQIVSRAKKAEIVITNKVPFSKETIEQLPDLKCICVSATGYNIIDIEAASTHGIIVCNAPNYSTESVAQHVFASVFAIYNRIENYAQEVRKGIWTDKNDWSYTNEPIYNVTGKTLGILGFGTIGQRVGEIGHALGMRVIANHRHPKRDAKPWVEFVELEELYQRSDILSLHVPLNASTKNIIDDDSLAMMKNNAFLINTGRGPLIDEVALADALNNGKLRAAALDVMVNEPPHKNNPLLECTNCYITPHIAWAGISARQNLMNILAKNIKGYQKGNPINKVN